MQVLLSLLLGTGFQLGHSFILPSQQPGSSSFVLYESSAANDIDFKSIYNLDEKFSQEEALKTGIALTKAIRQVKVDYESELKTIGDEIKQLELKRAYTKLAYWCFDTYIETGKLDRHEKLNEDKKYSGALDMEEFDYELMNTCLSKYGMQCNNVGSVTMLNVFVRALGMMRM